MFEFLGKLSYFLLVSNVFVKSAFRKNESVSIMIRRGLDFRFSLREPLCFHAPRLGFLYNRSINLGVLTTE